MTGQPSPSTKISINFSPLLLAMGTVAQATQHDEIALERARCTIEGTDSEPNSSTVVLQRSSDAQWRILIDDPGLG